MEEFIIALNIIFIIPSDKRACKVYNVQFCSLVTVQYEREREREFLSSEQPLPFYTAVNQDGL
jgi:hypothetical protein